MANKVTGWLWGTKRARWMTAGVVGALVIGAGSAAALATIPSAPGVLNGCYDNGGRLRVIDPALDTCKSNEVAISWNQAGPTGAPGPAGPAGPTGPAGPAGAPGASGPGAPNRVVIGRIVSNDLSATPIDILGYRWGVTAAVDPVGGAGAGKATLTPLKVTKVVDANSQTITGDAISGRHLREVKVEIFQSGASYNLTDVFIDGVTDSHTGATDALPLEEVSFTYARFALIVEP